MVLTSVGANLKLDSRAISPIQAELRLLIRSLLRSSPSRVGRAAAVRQKFELRECQHYGMLGGPE